MNDFTIKKLKKNQIDDMIDGLVNVMRYSNSSIIYPSLEDLKPDKNIDIKWFYPIFNGSNSFSELSAIHMYVNQESSFEDIGELMLGIGLVEMQHFGKLSEFIKKMGGDIDEVYSNEEVEIGENSEQAIRLAIDGEVKTINFYKSLSEQIEKISESDTKKIALQLIAKIKADEDVHLNLLSVKLKEYGSEKK